MKNTLILILVITLINTSCKDDINYGDLVDTGITLSLITKDGEDLLNPEIKNHLTENDINLFREEAGELFKYVIEVNLDQPKSFRIIEGTPYFRITMSPRTPNNEQFPIVYIEWGDIGMDTVKFEIVRKNDNAYEVTKKVWYNGEKVYDQDIEYAERHFIITKDIRNEENK